jgi:hypothetical protein
MPLSLYSKDSTDALLADKLDLAGGTMTGGLTLSATGIIFSDSTTMTTAPAGGALAADQLTDGVVAVNPTAGPTTAGDVLQYDGTDLIWTPGASGSFLPLAGGAMDADAEVTLSDTSNHDSELAGWGLGVQLTNDHAQGTTVEYNGLDVYDSAGHMNVAPTGLTFPDATVQTTAGYPNTNPDGFQTSTDVSTYVSGLGYLTDAPVDGFAYNRKDGAWEVAGSGGSVAWGAITGTVTDQTDLVTYVTGLGYQTAGDVSTYVGANAYPLSGNPSGFLTSVPGKSVYNVTSNAYTLVSGDANNIVYVGPGTSGGFPPVDISVPDDATYTFPIGTVILVVVNNTTGASDVNVIQLGMSAPTILGTVQIPSASLSGIMQLIKVGADLWICGKLS